MGTNYYLRHIPTQEEIDKTKRLLDERKIKTTWSGFGENIGESVEDMVGILTENLHIGKQSGGWQFVFRTNEKHYESNYKSLIKFLTDAIASGNWIFEDEYGYIITIDHFEQMVKDNKRGYNYLTWREDHPNARYYDIGNDFLAADKTWWCKVDFC